MVELRALLPAVAVLIAGIVSSAWCLVHGSTIGASAMIERKEVSVWGRVLSVAGFTILILGVLSALTLMMPEKLGLLISIAGEIIVAAAVLVSGKLRATKAATIFLGMAGVSLIPIFYVSGGGVGMIPVEVWRSLLGALIMIGATICAAVCIVSAVKAGSAAMMEKSELSIWSLLFVALGEGLAIYGLIVALLLIM